MSSEGRRRVVVVGAGSGIGAATAQWFHDRGDHVLAVDARLKGNDMLDGVRTTIGRHGTVDDMTPVIGFLSSVEACWVNGQDIHVDGGFTTALVHPMPERAQV